MFGQLKNDLMTAGIIGVVVATSVACATYGMGNVGNAEARRLLEATIPTSRLFCSAILTVSATVLALMLTMVGLGRSADAGLSDAHYHRIIVAGTMV